MAYSGDPAETSHISKTVVSIVKFGGPEETVLRILRWDVAMWLATNAVQSTRDLRRILWKGAPTCMWQIDAFHESCSFIKHAYAHM